MPRLSIWMIGLFFGLCEAVYFGWNLTPKSDAEMICDGITAIILALAFVAPQTYRARVSIEPPKVKETA